MQIWSCINNIAQNPKHPHFLFGESYLMLLLFLKKKFKKLFDYGMGIHWQKEEFENKM